MSQRRDCKELNASADEYRPDHSVEEQPHGISEKELYQESYERCAADLEILSAAYPEEISILNTHHDEQLGEEEIIIPDWFPLVFTLMLPDLSKKKNQSHHGANITMEFPMGYPTEKPLQIVSYRGTSSSKKDHVEAAVAAIRSSATESFEVYGGEECALACCAAAIESWNDCHERDLAARMSAAKLEEGQVDNESPRDDDIHWMTAEDTLMDRKSVFQCHICKVSDEDMVKRAVNKLIDGSSKIQRATHNMFAYRITEVLPDGKIIVKHDNDDDGEHGAGSSLAHLIEMRKEDGVLVLVSRWYGGIHLGPKRFAHIVNVARDHLVQCHNEGKLQ